MTNLVSYWKKQKAALKSLLSLPKRNFGKAKIHSLRVELKKLNALLLMIEFKEKKFDRKKFYKPFRSLFSLAGKVRELQIEKGILKKFKQEEIPAFMDSLDRKIDAEKTVFFKTRNRKLYSKIEKRLKRLNPMVRKLEKTDCSNYLKSLVLEIKTILATGNLDVSNGHLARKKLQTLKFNLESLQDFKSKPTIRVYEEWLRLLGSWHDLVKVNELLKLELGAKQVKSEEIAGIEQIRQNTTKKSAELIQEINLKALLFNDFILPSKL